MDLQLRYERSPAVVENNGHTIEVIPEEGGGITLDSIEYALVQFHFHTPSEHTVAGSALPVELHLVHRSGRGRLAVLGVLLEEGSAHEALREVFERAPAAKGEVELEREIDAGELLPADRATFRYMGSLTTPPCSEGVHWTVFQTPAELSGEQIDAFTRIYVGNARPVQPLNERTLVAG